MDYIIEEKLKHHTGRVYFSKKTEDAICCYNKSKSTKEREKIYHESIHFPFYKLTQNIIHTFKFYHTDVEKLEDLQHEIMIFLLSKIHLFDPSKGAKAYSYFGTIVKRYLIAYNNKNYKIKQNLLSLTDIEQKDNNISDDESLMINDSRNLIEQFIDSEEVYDGDELCFDGYKKKDRLSHFLDNFVEYCTERLYEFFPKKNDAQIADSVLEIFRRREHIDVFNKKALYIYIREMVDVKTPKITKIINKLFEIFEEKYSFYKENGFFKH